MPRKALPTLLLLFLMALFGAACAETPDETAQNGDDTANNDANNPNNDAPDVLCQAPALPDGPSGVLLAAAGAPLSLFGPEETPTFENAFDHLSEVGFNAFFPWFGIQEVDGQATVSGHFDYWLPASFSGAARHCGRLNPYAAADGRLGVIFPAFFFSNAVGDNLLDPDTFRQRFALFEDECWGQHADNIVAHQSFDEIASQKMVNVFFDQPGPNLGNTALAADLLRELDDAPVILIEGPLPLVVEREPGLTQTQRDELIEGFWQAVDESSANADLFGFDVYPVPDFPLSLLGEYTQEARRRAPQTTGVAVLQAFSYNAETARMDPRRGPTYEESRFMALDAIIQGAPNLIWYGASALDLEGFEDDRTTWEGVEAVLGLLSGLGSALSAPAVQVSASGDATATGRTLPDGLLIMVTHHSDTDATVSLTLPEGVDGVVDLESGIISPHDGGATLEIPLGAWDSRVLQGWRCP